MVEMPKMPYSPETVANSAVTRIACCQVTLAVGELERNRATVLDAVERAAAAGAQVVVLPELASSGYVFRDAAEAATLAEPVDGPTVTGWIDAARRHDLIIVGGFCELDAAVPGRLRNSAVLVDGSGVRALYRKTHLWDQEKGVFEPGGELPPIIDTPVGRIGVMICYDLEFPEWVRTVALGGADLLCAPVNWPLFPRPDGERPADVVRVQADAAVNRIFVAACDRAGEERGVNWTGGSVVVDPEGYPVAGPLPGYGEGMLLADCHLAAARDKHPSDNNHVLSDRRPDLYQSIL